MSKHALSGVEGFIKRGGEIYIVDPRVLISDTAKNIRDSYGDDEDDLSLKEWIRENGSLKLPPLDVQKQADGTLLIRDGYRRHWAMMQLINDGVDLRQVYVRLVDKNMTDEEALFYALSAGQGKRPSPLEEARTFDRLKSYGYKVEEIAKRIGKSVPTIYERLRLINATSETREAIKNGSVGVSVASKAIATAGGDAAAQAKAIRKASAPKIRLVYSRKSDTVFIKGNPSNQQRDLLLNIFNKTVIKALDDAGIDHKTVTFSVAVKVDQEKEQTA